MLRSAKVVRPVPVCMAAVMATTVGSSSASCESVSPNTCEKSGLGAGSAPVTGSNELTPWYFSGACSVYGDALTLLRHDMQQHRLAQIACPAQHLLQLRLIVPVHRTNIVKAHIVEHIVRQYEVFHALLHMVQYLYSPRALPTVLR